MADEETRSQGHAALIDPAGFGFIKEQARRKGMTNGEYIAFLAQKEIIGANQPRQPESSPNSANDELKSSISALRDEIRSIRAAQAAPTPVQPPQAPGMDFKGFVDLISTVRGLFPQQSANDVLQQFEAWQGLQDKLRPDPIEEDPSLKYLEMFMKMQDKGQGGPSLSNTRGSPGSPATQQTAIQAPNEDDSMNFDPLTDEEITALVREAKRTMGDMVEQARSMPRALVIKYLERKYELMRDEAEKVYKGLYYEAVEDKKPEEKARDSAGEDQKKQAGGQSNDA